MSHYLIKILVTTLLVVVISEVSKRNNFIGAMLASVPVISILAMIWLYGETQNVALISSLSKNIFWLVIPSLALFISLPICIDYGMNFYLSLILSITITIACYLLTLLILNQFGVKL